MIIFRDSIDLYNKLLLIYFIMTLDKFITNKNLWDCLNLNN